MFYFGGRIENAASLFNSALSLPIKTQAPTSSITHFHVVLFAPTFFSYSKG